MGRYPIVKGTLININGVSIEVDDCIGEGSTCLVYNGKVMDDRQLIHGAKVTIKEFYPKSSTGVFDITRNSEGKLYVNQITRENSEYKERKKQFEAGYEMQKHLANSEVMEVMVKPLLFGEYGGTSYLVSDVHVGKSLDKVVFETLADKLSCAVRVVELLGILHQYGYMMLDFKPENFLWTEHPKSVKLIDSDSIYKYKSTGTVYGSWNGIPADVGEENVFYINQKYCAPEILLLKRMLEMGTADFAEKKHSYLTPDVNVYHLGQYLFELLFERMPSEEDKEFPKSLGKELYSRYKSAFGSSKTADNLMKVLKKSLQMKSRIRYPNGSIMMDRLNTVMEEITSRKYLPKKMVAKANNTYLSYNLLEQYPLYEYAAHTKQGKTVLDVVIAGENSFRESLLKAVISCGQMLDTDLNVRLIAKDAEDFWEYYKSDACNPEVERTVRWFINGKPFDNGKEMEEAKIVDLPLANVYLETDDSDERIKEVVGENGTAYIVFAYGKGETNGRKAANLIKALPERKHFVGYLLGEQERKAEKRGRIDIYPISMEKLSDGYNEKSYKSQIYKMGMGIHEYYYRGGHPRAGKEEVRKSYAGDIYNIESSERSALHTDYKLKSIGIDPKSAKAPYLYYEKVLSSDSGGPKELFDKLAALEHRSWTAFLVLSGVRAVDDIESLKTYAYVGKNDWKEKNDSGQVIAHPCLKASRPGRKLTPFIWEGNRNGINGIDSRNDLDPLDTRCLEIYSAIHQIAEEKKREAERSFEDLGRYIEKEEAVRSAYNTFLSVKEKVFGSDNNETNTPIFWSQALEEFIETCAVEGILSKSLKEKISVIEELMKPILWCTAYHDFKKADEDILRAMPRILIQNGKIGQKSGKTTIVKPMAEEAWKNIYSTLVVQPDLLVLVPFRGEGEAVLKQYAAWLKSCRVDTKVQISTHDKLREYGGEEGQIFIDETGADAASCREVSQNPYMKNAHLFQVKGRKLEPTDKNSLITLFNRPVNLTVQETLMLHGAEMISEKKENGILGLSVVQYKSLWNLYRALSDGRKWKVFINELQRLEKAKQFKTELGRKGAPSRYEAGYAEGDVIKKARIGKVLAGLSSHGLVTVYRIPEENNYGLVYFSTPYQALGEMLKEAISLAIEEPLHHIYQAEIKGQMVILSDESLYVSGEIPHEPDKELEGAVFYRDIVMGEIYRILERDKGKDKALQNFQFGEDCKISFRYASKAVKEALRKEGTLLEAVVFHECRRRGVFDDIRANVEILWPGGRTRNEVDIIGTKDSKTYFISVKMCMPEQGHINEIRSLCEMFSVEGHAILVSSYFATGRNEAEGTDYRTRPVAIENRAEDVQRYFGNLSYIGRDGVDVMRENERHGKSRKFLIASSIADIVEKEGKA